VILNLAAFFAWHAFWPQDTPETPFAGSFDWFPVIVAIAAFVALWQYKAGIIKCDQGVRPAGTHLFICPLKPARQVLLALNLLNIFPGATPATTCRIYGSSPVIPASI
jgi:hypothetical protein